MKRNTIKKFSIYLTLAAVALCSFSGCKTKESTSSTTTESTDTATEEESDVFSIGVCLSNDNEYYNYITTGFIDAVKDTLGEENVEITSKLISDEASGETIIQEFLNQDVDLIFANGKAALSAASISTTETPIVAAGVIDFKSTLHILDDGWNRYTGRNITGISGSPSVSNQLSLLLETNPTMKSVGILYSAEDTDSIYQNEILENYLDEAGIPWKEYELTSSAAAAAEYEAVVEAGGSIILPGDEVIASAKEGSTMDVESLGEDDIISDIRSPNSARSPKTSKFWETLTVESSDDEATDEASEADTDDEATSTETESTETANTSSDISENASLIETACSECDALYIAADSNLTDQIETITSIANANLVSTIGGDMTLGEYTLVTLYSDPYDMGYRAGKLAKRILADGENPGEIKIGLPSSTVTKLYQDTIAELFEIEFPKSFEEYDEFISTYEVGSNTTRVETEEGEDD